MTAVGEGQRPPLPTVLVTNSDGSSSLFYQWSDMQNGGAAWTRMTESGMKTGLYLLFVCLFFLVEFVVVFFAFCCCCRCLFFFSTTHLGFNHKRFSNN